MANAEKDTKIPNSPMITHVVEAQFALQKQARERVMEGGDDGTL